MPEFPYGATLNAFNAKEVYSHLKGSPCCIICRKVLGEVAYRLRVPGQERDGVHYWSYGAEFCSEEHELHWLKHDYPKHRFDYPTIADGLLRKNSAMSGSMHSVSKANTLKVLTALASGLSGFVQ